MDDITIKRAVESALEFEPSIDAADIGVTVDAGIVTLTGRLPTFFQKFTTERTVKRVKGVRGYVDRIEIRLVGPEEADEAIARRAANVIDWDVSVPTGTVKVGVRKGVVTLTGEVPWQYQRVAAERAIRGLSGVRGLSNQIAVKPVAEASDIKRRIEEALDREADLAASKIRISVDGGRVRLQGKVKAWLERDLAERACWGAPGVREVKDEVSIGI